ncbi:MAG: DUF4298 domain-containing protein [Clostridia bacterium]|nr:DUF4298 domain-containing protein [Clostridia bacterium]
MEEAIRRIERMEKLFDEVDAAYSAGWTQDAQLQEKRRALEAYMDSGAWLADYLRDERGELPASLKRGVLSQDGLYHLLAGILEKENER